MKNKSLNFTLGMLIAMSSISGATKLPTIDHRLSVQNNSGVKITDILASTDGDQFVKFTVPNGIKPGQTVEVNWNRGQGHQCD